jgi:sugar O-acyltransferase (sialic acid O-acetyltransferase NeuD family)
MKKNIILIGGGGHAQSSIDVIEAQKKFKIIGIFDNSKKTGTKIGKYKILGRDKDIPKFKRFAKFALITIGQIKNSLIREKIFKKLKNIGIEFPTIISPYSIVSRNAIIEEGTIIHHNTVINSGVEIGKNCIINTNTIIEHNSKIKDHSHISTSVTINGDVEIGSNTFVGSGSVLKNSIKIKDFSFIPMGTVLKK